MRTKISCILRKKEEKNGRYTRHVHEMAADPGVCCATDQDWITFVIPEITFTAVKTTVPLKVSMRSFLTKQCASAPHIAMTSAKR